MSNLDVALAGFWQIARHWKQGDTAKLKLSCDAGSLHMQLSAKLGHPDLPHFPSVIPKHSLKKKSPSQLRRQERRRQEALNRDTEVNHSEKTAVDLTTAVTEKPKQLTKKTFKCNHCDEHFKNEKGLKSHIGRAYKPPLIQTPEKERSTSFIEEAPLTLTPNQRVS